MGPNERVAPQKQFNVDPIVIDTSPITSRAEFIQAQITEAYYSTHNTPQVGNYEQLIHQTAELLWMNPHDTRPIQMLYVYFVAAGSERMEQTLQDLGHYLVNKYVLPFEYVEQLLNVVVKRLAALGRMRHIQAGAQQGVSQYRKSTVVPYQSGGRVDRYA